ncbi:methyl-accepting chemotaxis protein [Paraburkholderia denitrificans]|uniref:Methyl-accepting chemotaxis protein n=1 Tax=Paraburkholderia denitrificans TaxID=694025 RepID=A0ABW0J6E7_9BURK
MKQLFSTVKSRIILVIAVSTVGTLIIGGFVVSGISALSDALHGTYSSIVIPTGYLSATQTDTLNSRLGLWRMVAQKDKSFIPAIRHSLVQIQKDWNGYYPGGVANSEARVLADKINGRITQFQTAVEKELALAGQGDFDGALAWQVSSVLPIGDSVTALLKQDVQLNADLARQTDVDGATKASRLRWISAALLLVGAFYSVGAALYLTRSITRPLRKTVSIARDIAQGRLDTEIVVDATGEFGQLLEAMKTMSERLATTIREIRDSSESVTAASGQIAAGNQDLSARTEEQAASLEQTAASMTELTETVKQNADNARQANSLAANARALTNAGSSAVGTMVATMQEISADSAKVGEITGMIESIAFQTNILALNAAVEAARAGEQGRGFAVVATEVRALAQRVSAAAREIKALIEVSSGKVQQGAQQAGDVGSTMDKVIQAIGRVSDIVEEISVASDEQSKGIQQAHQAINLIDDVTQQNAALVEEAAAAAQSLQEQAARMASDVLFFRLGVEASALAQPDFENPEEQPATEAYA